MLHKIDAKIDSSNLIGLRNALRQLNILTISVVYKSSSYSGYSNYMLTADLFLSQSFEDNFIFRTAKNRSSEKDKTLELFKNSEDDKIYTFDVNSVNECVEDLVDL